MTTIRDACAERTRAKIEARDGVKNARCVSSATVDANGSRARVCRWARDSRVHPEAPRSFEGDGTHRRVMTRERILLGRRRRFPFPRARGRAATSERDARSVRAARMAPRAFPTHVPATPPRAEGESPPTVTCVCALGVPARRTSAVLASARETAPMPEWLSHAKRARGSRTERGTTEVLVTVVDGDGGERAGDDGDAEAAAREDAGARAFLERHAEEIAGCAFVKVVVDAPEDKATWEEACRTWPVTMRAKTEREAEATLSEREREYFREWMTKACEEASTSGEIGNCAIIVDPSREVEIARGVDESKTHPLRHAALCAVELAAKRDVEAFPEKEHVQTLIDARREEKIKRDEEIRADEKKRKREEKTKGSTVTDIMGRPYLCTGYDIFLAREPCIMCAMALVHSRVKRVIFAAPDGVNGALSGKPGVGRLHGVRSLNHHYAVFSYNVRAFSELCD